LIAAVALTAHAPGCAVGTPAASDDLGPLVATLERIADTYATPGFVLVVVRDGHRTIATRGVADVASGLPLTDAHLVRVGSVTKTFAALTLVRLAARGAIDLDTVVDATARGRPAWPLRNPDFPGQPVTLAALAEHTAGLSDLSIDAPGTDASGAPLPLVEAIARARKDLIVRWRPRTFHQYSNLGYGYLAYAVQRLTDTDFETLMAEEVFAPLGMDSATLAAGARVPEDIARGYDTDGRTPIAYWHMPMRPFGAANLTPADMGTLVAMFLARGATADGRFLSETWIARMLTPATSARARAGIAAGYGLGLYASDRDGVRFFTHGGDADGHLGRFAFAPALGAGYFLGINAYQNAAFARMRAAVERHLIEAGGARANPPPVLELENTSQYLGTYTPVTWRFGRGGAPLTVDDVDGTLVTRRHGRARPLVPVTATTFRREGDAGATSGFVELDGTRYFLGESGAFRKLENP